jgi:hypothetical protein
MKELPKFNELLFQEVWYNINFEVKYTLSEIHF